MRGGVDGGVTISAGIKTHFLRIMSVVWREIGWKGGVSKVEDKMEVSSMGISGKQIGY